jgi:hypothetical protein
MIESFKLQKADCSNMARLMGEISRALALAQTAA